MLTSVDCMNGCEVARAALPISIFWVCYDVGDANLSVWSLSKGVGGEERIAKTKGEIFRDDDLPTVMPADQAGHLGIMKSYKR